MRRPQTLIVVLLVGCLSCRSLPGTPGSVARHKITFDLSHLDDRGLRGPADGKVAVSYEFCIPNSPEHKAEVKSIDPSVQFMPGSRGRIGCGSDECLCIGSTHQTNFRQVLERLAGRPYIRRIDECFFE